MAELKESRRVDREAEKEFKDKKINLAKASERELYDKVGKHWRLKRAAAVKKLAGAKFAPEEIKAARTLKKCLKTLIIILLNVI